MLIMVTPFTEIDLVVHKHFKSDPIYYKKVHSRIRRDLALKAFNNFYQCADCGSHIDLQVHIPLCNPLLEGKPGFFSILCSKCHKKKKGKP